MYDTEELQISTFDKAATTEYFISFHFSWKNDKINYSIIKIVSDLFSVNQLIVAALFMSHKLF